MAGLDDGNPPPPPTSPQTTTQQAPHTISTIKLPILKKVLPPRTAEETLAREREKKARTTLLMALPEDHLAKFYKMTDAKEMWDAIKSRFEGLHKGYDRFQSLLSQLEIHGAGVSSEDANQKFLRSLPSSWSQVSLIMRTKPGVDDLSFDDLCNNLRVFKYDLKGFTTSFPLKALTVLMMLVLLMVVMISMRLKKFYKKTGRKLHFDAKEPGIKMPEEEMHGNFRYKAKDNERRLGKHDEPNALVTLDDEGINWTAHADDKQKDFALMTFSNTGSNTEKVEAQLVIHQQNQLWYEEMIRFIKIDLDDKTDVLTYHKKLLVEALKEKEELNTKFANWKNSSKNLRKLLNSLMSANDKFRLGYRDHRFDGILSYEHEVLQSVFINKDSDVGDRTLYDRFVIADGIHVVPPPMTGNYMPSGPNIEIDESQFTYGSKQSKSSESYTRSSDFNSCKSNSSEETLECMPELVVNEPKEVSQPKVWSNAPIIEEYESDSDDYCVSTSSKEQE
ncbi:hypothetical protein Tco_0214478 [Tanacetum coccineum]